MKTVKEIVKKWLIDNKYDGLCDPDYECGCEVNDLMPCDMPNVDCMAGVKGVADPSTGYDFVIVPAVKAPEGE